MTDLCSHPLSRSCTVNFISAVTYFVRTRTRRAQRMTSAPQEVAAGPDDERFVREPMTSLLPGPLPTDWKTNVRFHRSSRRICPPPFPSGRRSTTTQSVTFSGGGPGAPGGRRFGIVSGRRRSGKLS